MLWMLNQMLLVLLQVVKDACKLKEEQAVLKANKLQLHTRESALGEAEGDAPSPFPSPSASPPRSPPLPLPSPGAHLRWWRMQMK